MVIISLRVSELSLFDFIHILRIGFVKLRGVFVFEITKTKTPKFTIKFVQKFGGKNRTEDNLAD